MPKRTRDPFFVAGLGVALVVGGLVLWLRLSGGAPQPAPDAVAPATLRAIIAQLEASEIEHLVGDAAAPVEVVEIIDYQCPGCRTVHEWSWPVLRPYIEAGRVRLRIFPVPLSNSAAAIEAALHAACVLETDPVVYPGFVLLLYFAQDRWLSSEPPSAVLIELVADSGGSPSSVESCVRSGDGLRTRLSGAYNRAGAAGLEWVPQLAVEGRPVVGVTEEELQADLRQAIEAALGAADRVRM